MLQIVPIAANADSQRSLFQTQNAMFVAAGTLFLH